MNGADAFLIGWVSLLLLLAGAWLTALEVALVRVARGEVDRLNDEKLWGAKELRQVVVNPAPAVNVVVFLRLVMDASACVGVGLVLAHFIGEHMWVVMGVAGLVLAMALFAVGGVLPRTLGRQYPLEIARVSAPMLRLVTRLLGPIPRLLVAVANAVTPGSGFRHGPFATDDEFRRLVDIAAESRIIDAEEGDMVRAVFELGETLVREVMVPRPDMVTIDVEQTAGQAVRLFVRSGHSRVPVIGDDSDDVVGVLYFKDVAAALVPGVVPAVGAQTGSLTDVTHHTPVSTLMRPASFVPESKLVDALLRDMQNAQAHVAMVVDEYGGIAGLVTIEDLLEEIVGDIDDEHDNDAPGIEELDDGWWRVPARTSIDDMAEELGLSIDEDEVDSVGGLLAKALGKVPIPGARGEIHGLEIVADRTAGRRKRLDTVRLRRVPSEEQDNS